MNEMIRNVRVLLTIVQDGEETVVDAAGEAVLRNSEWVVRYRETSPDLAGVVTTLTLGRDAIAVKRDGAVRSEQRFAAGRSMAGTYETPYGTLPLETRTTRLEVRFNGSAGEAEWAYELFIGGTAAGTFLANLHVQEAEA